MNHFEKLARLATILTTMALAGIAPAQAQQPESADETSGQSNSDLAKKFRIRSVISPASLSRATPISASDPMAAHRKS